MALVGSRIGVALWGDRRRCWDRLDGLEISLVCVFLGFRLGHEILQCVLGGLLHEDEVGLVGGGTRLVEKGRCGRRGGRYGGGAAEVLVQSLTWAERGMIVCFVGLASRAWI